MLCIARVNWTVHAAGRSSDKAIEKTDSSREMKYPIPLQRL